MYKVGYYQNSAELKRKEIDRKMDLSAILDLKIKRGWDALLLVRRWFFEDKRFSIWLTNLPATAWKAEEIMTIHLCRWQV
jgi:hypothetical protein